MNHDVVVIGAGQAGLAASHHLSAQGIEHLILEAEPVPAFAWRNRWDSFTLVTPNILLQMPGAEYQGSQPEGNLTRAEVCAYIDEYARGKPVQYSTRVTAVEAVSDGFSLSTSQGSHSARQVIVATGALQSPKIPNYASRIPKDIFQIDAGRYRSPASLPDGPVLVVGSAQTGCQLVEEINAAGHKVYLSVGRAGRLPRRYRGRDSVLWLRDYGFFDMTPDSLPSPQARFNANPQLTGKGPPHDLNLHQFARDGVTLLGHILDADGYRFTLARDLHENLARTDTFEADWLKKFDTWIASHALDAPPMEERPDLKDGFNQAQLEELDLKAAGIRSILWACGFSQEYPFLHMPVFDSSGWPLHEQGVTPVPGLYFMGLPWLSRRKSNLLLGVGEDAAYLAGMIAGKLGAVH